MTGYGALLRDHVALRCRCIHRIFGGNLRSEIRDLHRLCYKLYCYTRI